MELSAYLQILARRGWIIIVTALTTLAAFILGQMMLSPSYQAESLLHVIPYARSELSYTQLIYADRIMNTYIEMATSGTFLESLRNQLGLAEDRPARITVEIIPESELLQISVEDQDPVVARDVANTLAVMLINNNPMRDISITLIDPATIPEPPSMFHFLSSAILALVVGLVAGFGLAFLVENLDSRLHTTQEIAEVGGLPVIGSIPKTRMKRNRKLLVEAFPCDDAFRRLSIRLLKITEEAELKSLMITSAQPGEGKSTIAASLAVSLAQTGCRVILVDADLYRPTIHTFFNVPNENGLSNLAQGEMTLSSALQKSDYPGLDLLSNGPIVSEPAELLQMERINPILSQLKAGYDFVLVDVPAYLAVADTAMLVAAVDGVLLVTRRGMVRAPALQATSQQLNNSDGRLLGLIINNARMPLSGGYYKNYRKSKSTRTRGPAEEVNEQVILAVPSIPSDSLAMQQAHIRGARIQTQENLLQALLGVIALLLPRRL